MARGPRTPAALLALASTTTGCMHEVRRAVDPGSLESLPAFRHNHPVRLRDASGAWFWFDADSELEFELPAGVEHRLACMRWVINGPILTCNGLEGIQRFPLEEMQRVRVVTSEVEAPDGRVVLVVLGIGLVVGIAATWNPRT